MVVVFGKFFYGQRNSNVSFRIDSSNFLGFINKEILLFGNNAKNNEDLNNQNSYSKMAVDGELSLVKMVASQNTVDLDIKRADLDANEVDTTQNTSVETAQEVIAENINSVNGIDEPKTRLTN